MSFWSDLTADGVLPADIRAALSITGTAVYVGRRHRDTPRPKALEVAIVRGPAKLLKDSGFGSTTAHEIDLLVTMRQSPGGDGTGKAQQTAVDAALRTLVTRYRGGARLAGTVSGIKAVSAAEVTPDEAPGARERTIGRVRTRWVVTE